MVPMWAVSSLPGFVTIRARETALHVPEEFRFEQRLGKTGAIDGCKHMTGARAA
jgi:hypothetical protein